MQTIRLEGKPFRGKELENLKAFLARVDLEYDDGIEYTVCLLNEDYQIVGTGSVEQNVLKCIAIAPNAQGEGLAGTIVSCLVQYEFEHSRPHLLMYTKPMNRELFEDLGFYTVLMTKDMLLMENKKSGFDSFVSRLVSETPGDALAPGRKVGAIVANCNPFTYGHRHLILRALKLCDYVHLLILTDKRSLFGPEERYHMVREGVRDLDRVILHRASDFVISAATFPTYFMKEKTHAEKAGCALDLELFGERIAPALHIAGRFVGTEPGCDVTRRYNEEMKRILPAYGIAVEEIPRKQIRGQAVSASEVRRLLERNDTEQLKSLIPRTTYDYLRTRRIG